MIEYTTKTYNTALVSYEGKHVSGDFTKQEADDLMYDAMMLAECFRNMSRALEASMKEERKVVAWYDPTNQHVSTNKDDPLFTPLGQVWPLYMESK